MHLISVSQTDKIYLRMAAEVETQDAQNDGSQDGTTRLA